MTLHLATEAVDSDVGRASEAGPVVLRAPADQSFGERKAMLTDPFGHGWIVSQPIETVTPEQMQKRREDETSA